MIEKLLLALGIIAIIFISGCTQTGAVCNKPYILVGNSCCLDKNDNGICDSDETAATQAVCGDNICNVVEDYLSCPQDCNKPIQLGKPIAAVRIYDQGNNYWTIFRREVYKPPPDGISSSGITIPISIRDKIEEIRIKTQCNVNESIVPNLGYFTCNSPINCNLGKTDINSDYRNVVRNLEKGNSVVANFVLWASFKEDDTYFFNCRINITGNNPTQAEILDFDFTYSNYVGP